MTDYALVRAVARKAGRPRIVIDGVDVTGLRDYRTPPPQYTLTEPFAYGASSIQFPQIHAGYEADKFGQPGELRWVRKGARVTYSRTFDEGAETIDYVGRVLSVEAYGRILNLDIGGEFSGPANVLEQQPQKFRYSNDVGHWASLAAATVGLTLAPWFGPVTGIRLTHVGGQSHLAWAQYVCSMSQDDNGIQRSLMPLTWGSGTWTFEPKDYTTKHVTVFNDDARVVLSVADDATEQPNVIYGTGVTPDGVRITNAKWPGVFKAPAPVYPISGGGSFGLGTTDSGTVNGDGVTVLYAKLVAMGYVAFTTPNTGTYDAAIVAGVKRLQKDARLSQTGTMTQTAWNRLFDVAVTGYSINGAYIAPLASDTRVEEFLRTANGSIAGRNPAYDPSVLRVERTIDYGGGITKAAMIAHAQSLITRGQALKNSSGTLRLNGFGGFVGEWSTADKDTLNADATHLMPARDIRPGMNVWVPMFDGGTLFHIAGADVDDSGVTLTIDTQARDLVEVREIISRNADSRRDLRREWIQANRPRKSSHAMISSDENFGWTDRNIALKGDQWNRIPLIAGQRGQVNRVDIRLVNSKAKFSACVMGTHVTEKQMARRVGNPLVISDESVWEKASLVDWFDNRVLLWDAGDGKQPGGYYPRRHRDDAGNVTSAPITGRLIDDNNWAYEAVAHTAVIVYLFIYPDRDCVLKKGQILYAQLDDAA